MTLRKLSWTTALLLAALALAACGGSSASSSGGSGASSSTASGASSATAASTSSNPADNGVSAKSADRIVAAAETAAKSAKSVHVSGAVNNGGQQIALDLDLAAGQGGRGSIAVSGASIQIVTIKSTVYLKASPKFWSLVGNAQVGQLLKNRWLKAPATTGVNSFTQFTDLQQLFKQLLASHGKLTKGPAATVDGQSVIGIRDATKGGTLYVATKGQPYPVRVSRAGGGGAVTFDHYNESVTLAPPAGAVDASQLSK